MAFAQARNLLLMTFTAGALALSGPLFAHEGEEEDDGGHLVAHKVGGVNIDGGMTWFLQGSDGNTGNDATDLTYTLDLNLSASVGEHGSVNIALESGNGAGIDEQLGSLSTANYDAFITELSTSSNSFNAPSISQAYYEGEYIDGRLVVDFGKLDIHSMYDDNAYANDETDQFLSGIFTRSAGTTYAELDEYYAPGIALVYALSDHVDVSLIGANGNNSGFDKVSNRPYGVVQITIKPEFGGLDGNYRLYGIHDWRRYTDTAGKATENSAYGISLDQALPGSLGVFARYSAQDDKLVENFVKSSWSLGAVVEGSHWGRDDDMLGAGYGSVTVNTDPVVLAAAGMTSADDETHLEIYYKFGFSDHFTFTPDIQVIDNNGGIANGDSITVYGARGQLNF